MIFDVMLREGYNTDGKQIIKVYRVHDSKLSEMLRNIQDEEKYIIAVIPLFRQRKEQIDIAVGDDLESDDMMNIPMLRFKKDIDPRLIKKVEKELDDMHFMAQRFVENDGF